MARQELSGAASVALRCLFSGLFLNSYLLSTEAYLQPLSANHFLALRMSSGSFFTELPIPKGMPSRSIIPDTTSCHYSGSAC